MKIEMVRITPEIARQYLEKNTGNRKRSERAVDLLASAMLAGEWVSNGDTIGFSGGVLIDGQHRLSAIIKSGVDIDCIVVHDLPVNAYSTKDIGKRRTIADSLQIAGEVSTMRLSSSVVTAMMIEDEWNKGIQIHNSGRYSFAQVSHYIESHPHCRSISAYSPDRYVGRPSISSALRILAANIGQDATEFVCRVFDGVGLEQKNPAYILRETLLKHSGSGKTQLSKRWEAAQWIKAYCAFRDGKAASFLRFKDSEAFPRLD